MVRRRTKSKPRYPKSFYERMVPAVPWCAKCKWNHELDEPCIKPGQFIKLDTCKIKGGR